MKFNKTEDANGNEKLCFHVESPTGHELELTFNAHSALTINQGSTDIEIPLEWLRFDGSYDEIEVNQGAEPHMGISRAVITSSIPGLDYTFLAVGIRPEDYYALMEFDELKPFFYHQPRN